ncbi:hypothetical protein SGLAM104S_02984 [Streptomyces glaucescens]
MPHSAPSAAPTRVPPPDRADPHDRTAPYVLVRTTVLPYPAETAPSAVVRTLLAGLTTLTARDAALRAALSDDLFAARGGHDEDFRRRVVLPLRRALHNGREPRPALLGRLGALPDRVPGSPTGWPCGSSAPGCSQSWTPLSRPPGRRALRTRRPVPLSRLHPGHRPDQRRPAAGDRPAGRGQTGRRARKEEASVLRHALRASTKTSPLSWFTAVGWAPAAAVDEDAAPRCAGARPAAAAARPTVPLTPVVQENRTLVAALTTALLDAPRRRRSLPHRLTSSARVADGRARYARAEPLAGGRYLVSQEDEVDVAARPALDTLAAILTDGPLTLGTLSVRLAAGLGRERDAAVTAFARPASPARRAARTRGARRPAAPRPAPRPRQLAAPVARGRRARGPDHRAGPRHPAVGPRRPPRPALLADLAARWRRLLADTGRPVAADAAPLTVLTEDVVAPGPLSPSRPRGTPAGAGAHPTAAHEEWPAGDGPLHPRRPHEALTELTAVAELFDLGHVIAGSPGTASSPARGGRHLPRPMGLRRRQRRRLGGGRAAPRPAVRRPGLPTGLTELAALREEFTTLARQAAEPWGAYPGDRPAVGPVRALADRLPDWTAARPLAYSHFVQHPRPRPPTTAPACCASTTSTADGAASPAARRAAVHVRRHQVAGGPPPVRRRRWQLGRGALDALRADLASGEGEVPVAAVARWRALLGLPEQLFLHPVAHAPSGRATDDFVARLSASKPQALDLGNALHLRCLGTWLARHPEGVVLEEALPAFGGRDRPTHVVESVVETYRPARRRTVPARTITTAQPPAPRRGGIR